MASMLTTKDVQEIINVDRSTIYRMAESGRLPAVKVGRQWRFPADELEAFLAGGTTIEAEPVEVSVTDLATRLLPGIAKPVADLVGSIFGVMVLVTDLDGEPLIEPSNPCGLFVYVHGSPEARARCAATWRDLSSDPHLLPKFRPTPLGFNCARDLIRANGEIIGMVVMGGVAPDSWPPEPNEIVELADEMHVDAGGLTDHIDEVYHVSQEDQDWILEYLPAVTSLFSKIAEERSRLVDRLDDIASLAASHRRSS